MTAFADLRGSGPSLRRPPWVLRGSAKRHHEAMAFSSREKWAAAVALSALNVAIVGGAALVVDGLSWSGFFGALLVALFASAVFLVVMGFSGAYHRHTAHAEAPPDYREPEDEHETLETFQAPEQPGPEERPRP